LAPHLRPAHHLFYPRETFGLFARNQELNSMRPTGLIPSRLQPSVCARAVRSRFAARVVLFILTLLTAVHASAAPLQTGDGTDRGGSPLVLTGMGQGGGM